MATPPSAAASLADHVRDIHDFPKPGVVFKDVTPLLADHGAFTTAVEALVAHFDSGRVDKVVGIEARGFILAAPIALHFGAGFIPARKAGKLPAATRSVTYDLEYGAETLELHEDAIEPGERVLIVDDVLATGGTAAATASLVAQAGGEIVGLGFLIELAFLAGAERIADHDHVSLLSY
jgi:adenine phosphoribosyltransferase